MGGEIRFQIVSHAGLRVNVGDNELLTDPWLLGSCYWRSWWNYPPVSDELVKGLRPNFIYLTHLHWDHFHAPSLRRFPPDTPIIVPYDRYDRMVRDLRAVGMRNIRELRHGERLELAPGLAIRSYHFSPFVTDSVVVIEAGDVVLLNANDAKVVGAPLAQILSDYPRIDFCFRSHSSANPRANFEYIGESHAAVDSNEHYLRAFALFIERVAPRFAIPFASNSCLLHDDVYHHNPAVQTPLMVEKYYREFAARRGLISKIQVMVAGDSWSSEKGFSIAEQDWFIRRPEHLEEYRRRVEPALEKQRKLEARIKVPLGAMEKFFANVARGTPRALLGPLRKREVLLVANSERETSRFAVNLGTGTVRVPDAAEVFDMRIEFPALVLLQSLTMNMFGQAGISKRVHYYATRDAMRALKRFNVILELFECQALPLRGAVSMRAAKALLPRWREGVLYIKVLADLARGYRLPQIEERQLERS
jgi:UDP-MurNAc hydroxylase